MTQTLTTITNAQKGQYENEGYFLLEAVIPDEHLELLRSECQNFIDRDNAEMDRLGVDSLGLNHRDSRYFATHPSLQAPQLKEFAFSPLMAEICRTTLGDEAYLFFEQYVVKAAEKGMTFSWHQDSGYVNVPHQPYLTCWCALDDMTEANGTVYVLPYSRAQGRDKIEHVQDESSNDLVGYYGDDPGVPVIVPAGSIAVFSSTTFHRSGFNTTDKMRRVYLAQYSGEVIRRENDEPWGRSEEFLKGGQIVAVSGS